MEIDPRSLPKLSKQLGDQNHSQKTKKTSDKEKYYFMISTYFSITILSDVFCWFLTVILVPELFKKLRETPGINFHQASCKSEELWSKSYLATEIGTTPLKKNLDF